MPGALQHTGNRGRDRAFAVSAGDVNRAIGKVRIGGGLEQLLGSLQTPPDSAGKARKQLFDQVAIRD